MKLVSTILLGGALSILFLHQSEAGGAATSFSANGLPLLQQSPGLRKALTSHFSIEDEGHLGPMDAPFQGRRMYTYMEFRAAAMGDARQRFVIRVHFDRTQPNLKLLRAEILPVQSQQDAATAVVP